MKTKELLRRKLKGFVLNHREIFTHNLFFPADPESFNLLIPDLRTNEIASDGLPLPPKNLWVGYADTPEEYILSGKRHVSKIFEMTGRSNYPRVLEFGCAAGRMMRHFKGNIWGVDISADHVNWCKQNLPFKFATITTIPHLPFRDDYFDLVFAGSVFTHIDDLSDAWLCELGRVCKGDVWLTIHDENTMRLMQTEEYKNLYLSNRTRESAFYQTHKTNFEMMSIGRDTLAQTFYKESYFRKMVEQVFDVLSIEQEAHGSHTAYALRVKT